MSRIKNLREEALALHKDNVGKIDIRIKVPARDNDDLTLAYSPGVAEPCKEINKDPAMLDVYTNHSNFVCVVSNGTAVLGLGDIGAGAAMPVMEGKSLLFKRFGDVDAFPLCVDTKDTAKIVELVELVAPTFGGVNLEDIKAPECFEIEDSLKARGVFKGPIFHDDQHGTAVVTLAGLLNALKIVGKNIEDIKVVTSGAGAAGTAIIKLLMAVGLKNVIMCDSKGPIWEGRPEGMNKYKEAIAKATNPDKVKGTLADAIKGADVFIGVSVPDSLNEDMIRSMAKDPIIFAQANPSMPSASLIKEFEQLVGKENVFSSEADRQSYAYDAAVLKPMIPSLVVRPTEVEQLGQVVKRCYEEGIPMTVRGSGTNLTGGTIPDCSDTIVILTTGLNKILEINTEDLYATVQPGVITAKFAAAVAAKGLFYPPDPGSMSVSTIGGNVAESSGGLRGLKYGTTKDYVMGMEVFANTGDLVKTGSRTVKCATGYNIAPLLVGSEGTLAVTSKVTLKLIPPPKASKAMMALFKDMDGASQAVAGIIAAHVVPCTLEFLDHASINYIEDYVKIGLPRDAGAMLLIEVDGHPAQVEDEAVIVEKVLRDNSATEIVVARDAAEKSRIWEARRVAIPALARCRPTLMLEDATVPRSKIPAMIKALDEIAARHNVTIATFGHAGDGNLHPSILCDRRDKEEFSRVERAVDDLFNAALELGGTLSGEHGIGTAKIKWLEQETSHGTIMFSRRLRKAFDPKGLFNPSKIVGFGD